MQFSINDYKLLEERRNEAIETARLNCMKFKNFMVYGVDTFVDRLPSFTTSILRQPAGITTYSDNKCDVLTKLDEDQLFIARMKNLFASLPDLYRDVFIAVYVNGKSLKSFHRNDIYKIIKRGTLKLALLDATIDYSYNDELVYKNAKLMHDANQRSILKKMKANLRTLQSLNVSHMIDLTTDNNNFLHIKNINMSQEEYEKCSSLVIWINELNAFKPSTGLSPKDCLIKYIFDHDWKYLDTTDRNNLKRGQLALAYLDPNIPYTIEDFEYDAAKFSQSQTFINMIKNFQLSLHI